jgi:F0F1-type ATP synthase assembly protein I
LNNKPKKPPYNEFAEYSQLAYQIIATLLICFFAGHFLDKYFSIKQPWFTLTLSVIGVIASIYLLIKKVTKNNK